MRNCQKKALIAHTHDLQVNTGIRGILKPSDKTKSATTFSEKRQFPRLFLEHEWRKLASAGIYEVIVE